MPFSCGIIEAMKVEMIKKARALTAEIYAILDEMIDRQPGIRSARKCKICRKDDHMSNRCPERGRRISSSFEFKDVLEKFGEYGSSQQVAEEMGLPVEEVNAALEFKDYKGYLTRQRPIAIPGMRRGRKPRSDKGTARGSYALKATGEAA